MNYPTKAITAFSRLANALILGGSVNESISARAWRMHLRSKAWRTAYRVINRMFFWQNNHCRGAHNNGRKEMQQWLDSK